MRFLVLTFFICVILSIPNLEKSFGETITKSMDAGMNIVFTYPDIVFPGRDFTITALLKNEGWEDKQDIRFVFSSDEQKIILNSTSEINVDKISANGEIGKSLGFHVSDKINPGTYYVNIKYSQILLANNKDPQNPFNSNFALPVTIKEQPGITIHTTTPESIFSNAEFPFDVEITSNDIDITDVKVEVIPPSDIIFRGETQHDYSVIIKNQPVSFSSRIITPDKEVTNEHKLPFEVRVSYFDDLGNEKTDTQTANIVLRPRSLMELTTDGGIWVGGFFLAPYISIGTIVGIPAGAIFSLLIKKAQKRKEKKKSRK